MELYIYSKIKPTLCWKFRVLGVTEPQKCILTSGRKVLSVVSWLQAKMWMNCFFISSSERWQEDGLFFLYMLITSNVHFSKKWPGTGKLLLFNMIIDNMTISVNKTNWNWLVSIISLDLLFYSLDFDLNVYLWARNVTGTLQKQQSSSHILKHLCDFSLPNIDLGLQSFQCSKIRSAQHWGRRAAHLSENKGVKRECKKSAENSRQMVPVSTTCDEYWGLRSKWWSCK